MGLTVKCKFMHTINKEQNRCEWSDGFDRFSCTHPYTVEVVCSRLYDKCECLPLMNCLVKLLFFITYFVVLLVINILALAWGRMLNEAIYHRISWFFVAIVANVTTVSIAFVAHHIQQYTQILFAAICGGIEWDDATQCFYFVHLYEIKNRYV